MPVDHLLCYVFLQKYLFRSSAHFLIVCFAVVVELYEAISIFWK